MLSALRRWFRPSAKPAPPWRSARPEVVRLEDRVVPTLLGDFSPHINTTIALNQTEVSSATSQAGARVTVWTHQYTATNTDIRGQRHDRYGYKSGPEFRVASAASNESAPDVAIDSQGRVYVAYVLRTSRTLGDIRVARFSASGVFLGSTTVAATTKNEYDPSIAVAPVSGSFVVSYTIDASSNNQDVLAKVFSAAGTLTNSIAVATSLATDETESDVARSQVALGDTPFAVVYSANSRDVMLKRYTSTSALVDVLTGGVGIAQTSLFENQPSISANNQGDFGFAWQTLQNGKWNITARVMLAVGTLSVPVAVTVESGSYQNNFPSVALKNDRDLVVGYQSLSPTGNYLVYATELDFKRLTTSSTPFLARRATYYVANAGYAAGSTRPVMTIDAQGYYTIAYLVYGLSNDPLYGVHSRVGQLA